jgi:hypothetical protein
VGQKAKKAGLGQGGWVDGDGAAVFAVLGAGRLVLCGACGKRKRNWAVCGMESGTWRPPCRYLVDKGACLRILAHPARGWKSLERPRKNFYLEHSPNARPTRQLSNDLIKSQLPQPPSNTSTSSFHHQSILSSHTKRDHYISYSIFLFSPSRLHKLICTRHYDSVIPRNLSLPSSQITHITKIHKTLSSPTTNNHHGSCCWY